MYLMANSEKISLRIDSKFYNKDLTDKIMIGGKKLRVEILLPNAKDKYKVSRVVKITTTGGE